MYQDFIVQYLYGHSNLRLTEYLFWMLTVRTFVSAGSPTTTPGWATTRTGICAESLASVKLTSRCYGDLWIEPAGHDRGKYEDRGTTEKIIQISWLGEHECHSELTRNGFHISSFVKQEDPVEATDGFVPFFFLRISLTEVSFSALIKDCRPGICGGALHCSASRRRLLEQL